MHEQVSAADGSIDPTVVAALYVEHGFELRRFVLGVLRDREAVNDVLQATFVKAVEQGHTARPESLKGWLFRVAFHEALTIKRRRAVQQKATQHFAWLASQRPETADDPIARAETVEKVRGALKELPAEQREVVRARIYDDKTFAEIAAELGLPLGTVLTRMRLGLAKLRLKLKPGE